MVEMRPVFLLPDAEKTAQLCEAQSPHLPQTRPNQKHTQTHTRGLLGPQFSQSILMGN